MSELAASRSRLLDRFGRSVILKRPVGSTSSSFEQVTIQGYFALFKPDVVGQGGILQGDAQVQIASTEVNASVLVNPRAGDQVIIDNRTWKVLGVFPANDGPTTIGYSLWIRGG